ncbi:hypothetical protein O9992_12685 [Vibrio lentus]|nr:hypothetical protein [Vibrio lentus]
MVQRRRGRSISGTGALIPSCEELGATQPGILTAGQQLIWPLQPLRTAGRNRQHRDGRPVVLKKRVILGGSSITDASSSVDEYGRPQVNISLDSEACARCSTFFVAKHGTMANRICSTKTAVKNT